MTTKEMLFSLGFCTNQVKGQKGLANSPKGEGLE